MIPADEFYEELGRAIRERREACDLKQADLGESLELSRTSITNIESGRQRLLADQLCRMADALGCEVPDLLQRALRVRRTAKKKKLPDDLKTMPAVAKFIEPHLSRRSGRS